MPGTVRPALRQITLSDAWLLKDVGTLFETISFDGVQHAVRYCKACCAAVNVQTHGAIHLLEHQDQLAFLRAQSRHEGLERARQTRELRRQEKEAAAA